MQYKCTSFCSFYKGSRFIEGYIQNMLEQTLFHETEFIFVNCASPEDEEKYIKPLINKYTNIKYIKLNTDPGLYAGWNIAIKNSSSSLVTNWNIDDRKSCNSLEILVQALTDNPELDMVYGHTYISKIPNETYENNIKNELFKCEEYTFNKLMKHNSPHCMPMWRKSIHENFGFFNEKYQSISDAVMWLSLCANGGKIKKIDQPVGLYYWNPHGKSTAIEHLDQNHEDLKKAKIDILTQCNDIEILLQPCNEFIDTYDKYKNIGYNYMTKQNALIITTAYNIEKYSINLSKINKLIDMFKACKLIIQDFGSLDDTHTILKNINSNNIETIYDYSDDLLLYGPIKYWNKIIKNIQHYKDSYDFIILLDLLFIDLSLNGIANSFGYLATQEVDAISGYGMQKEIYEAVNRLFLVNRYAESYRPNYWSSPLLLETDYTYDLSFSYRMNCPIVGAPPIKVNSNYGGCLIYKMKDFINASIADTDEDIYVSINKSLYQNNPNFKLYLNPSQLVLTYYDN